MVEHDVVIIGAGHNGLVAANYLSDAGLDVLVVEANERIGGMTASGCPIPDAPRHVVNYCSADLLFWMASPVATELDLARYGLRTVPADPSYAYLHPDGASLAIWRDPRKTAEEVRHFSPSDAESYLDYARLLDGLFDLALPFMLANLRNPDWRAVGRLGRGALRHRGLLRQFGAFVLASGEEVIDERFHHPVVRAAMHCVGAGANPISDNGTSVTHLLLGFLHRVGAVRPIGGMQAVPDALATRLQAVGGRVVTEAPVAEILVHSGRARGVALADGTVIQARRAVLATCDPRTALERLLPAGTLSPRLESRVRHIPANAGGAGQMKVDLALSGKVDLSRHRRWRTDGLDLRVPACLIGSPEGNRRAFARSSAGMLPDTEDIALWPVVTTALDPTQAPPGQDTLYLYCAAMPLQPEGGWKQREGEAADAIVRRAEQFYDGISAVEIGRWVETPEAMADRTGATNGAVLHADMTLLRSGPLRPALGFGGFRLPIDDLYIGGAGAHPGGGVTGLPGRLAAREILRRRSRRAR